MSAFSDSDEELEMHPFDPFNLEITPFNYQDPLTNSTILQAVLVNDIIKIGELIAAGRSMNVVDNNGNTALHLAALNQSEEMVQLLLKHGSNVNNQNFTGHTPLLMALEHGVSQSIINQFLVANCNINITNYMEDTALNLAIRHSTPEVVQLLIEYGADINAQDGSLFTPLHEAVYCAKIPIVYMLLYYNADTSIVCHKGLTPFMHSLTNLDALEITEILFLYYDEFTDITSTGETAFCIANDSGNPIAIKLVKAGLSCGYTEEDTEGALNCSFKFHKIKLFRSIMYESQIGTISGPWFTYMMHKLFQTYTIPVSNWTRYFYILIENSLRLELNFYFVLNTVTVSLLEYLSRNNMGQNWRIHILWTFLLTGVNIGPYFISECFYRFGNNEELEILFNVYDRNLRGHIFEGLRYPITFFDHMFLQHSAVNFKIKLEQSYSVYFGRMCDRDFTHSDQLHLGYMSFSPKLFEYFNNQKSIQTKPMLVQQFKALCSTPSLLELSRNATALHIVSSFNLKHPYEFFEIVNRAYIPKVIKDILLYRKTVYYM